MLPKPQRLVKKYDFDRVFKNGRVLKGPFFRLICAEGEGRGAVVAAKSLGSNAHRNMIRRRWREALGSLETLAGKDFVFVIGAAGRGARGFEAQAAMREALAKVA